MALNPGDMLLNNHDCILRQLGRGGFGFVHLARDTLPGEQVAVKELSPALVGDEATVKRCLAEASATMRIRHKRIVATHNIFFERDKTGDTWFYIVMEYVPGGSLEARLWERGPLPVGEAVRVAAEVYEGLACTQGALSPVSNSTRIHGHSARDTFALAARLTLPNARRKRTTVR
jgi:serine/threonine protein kinase